jgi:hypothetical protein
MMDGLFAARLQGYLKHEAARSRTRLCGAGLCRSRGGETLHVDMVRDLRGTVERDGAPFGVLITLRKPNAPMIKEAATAGSFDTPFGKFPRLQIATVDDMLAGKLPKLPPQEKGGGFKQAAEEEAPQAKVL